MMIRMVVLIALANLWPMDAADDSAVRRNLQPCIEWCAALTAGRELVSCGAVIERNIAVTNDEAATKGDTGQDKAAARKHGSILAGVSGHWPAPASMVGTGLG